MGSIKREPRFWVLWPGLAVGGCFVTGGILGCLFGTFASGESTEQLGRYLGDYMTLAGDGMLSWSVPAVLWNQGRWLLVCALLGLTGLGVAALPVLFGVRGFLVAFSVSCFVRFFGGVGLLPALLMFGLPALFWAPGFFLTGILGLSSSYRLLRRRMGDLTAAPGNAGAFRSSIALSLFLLVLCVILECSLLPALLPSAARILG